MKDNADRLQGMMEKTIKALTLALEMRDPYTGGHERRVAQLACAMAAVLRLSEDQIEGIRIAGYFHDIGKIAVPAEILAKAGKISEYERGVIKTHPQCGYNILKAVRFMWPIALVALQHHERMNGCGYPGAIAGETISMEARIIGVADVVEAMSSHRPYRPAMSPQAALAEITKHKGILYDPHPVDACVELFTRSRFQFE